MDEEIKYKQCGLQVDNGYTKYNQDISNCNPVN